MLKRKLKIFLPLTKQPIVHIGYDTKEEAEKAYEAVSHPRFNHWLVEIFNYHKRYYVVMPESTFHILRRNDFSINNQTWEVMRIK